MNIKIPEHIDRTKWMQLLHTPDAPDAPATPDAPETSDTSDAPDVPDTPDAVEALLSKAEAQLLEAARPRGIYRVAARGELESTAMEGMSIEKHLEGCDRVAVLAVTIGAEIDQLIARTQVTDMALAVVMDAGASVLAEQAADSAEAVMKEELAEKLPGTFFTARFSPGYGDYPVRYQREILRSADAGRRIGLTLTAGDMMVPHKSITALVGLADDPVSGRLATCDECVLRDKCGLRRAGRHC